MNAAVNSAITDPGTGSAPGLVNADHGTGGAGAAPAPGTGQPAGGTPAPGTGDPGGAPASASGAADPGAGAAPGTGDPGAGTPAWITSAPEGWRDEFAGDNPAFRKHLDRVTNFKDVADIYWNAQEKIRKGEISTGLPENPTDEQLGQWREAHGIPESPDKYQVDLQDGVVLSDTDQRIMDAVKTSAHADNVPGATLSKLSNAWLAGRAEEERITEAKDADGQRAVNTALQELWGGEYKGNINRVMAHLNGLSEETQKNLMSGRLADGTAIFNNAEVVAWMESNERKLNPGATVVPDAINQVQAISDKLKEYEKRMGDDPVGWHKDKEANDHYLALVRAQENMQRRG